MNNEFVNNEFENNEFNILMDVYTDLCKSIDHIKSSKDNIIRINDNIKNLNNNYFETQCESKLLNDYLKMFDCEETYDELVTNLECLRSFIKYKIGETCKHNWIHDCIDIDQDRSQEILYCSICEVTKK